MNRQELLSKAWIRIRDIIPPDDETKNKQVLVYLYHYHVCDVMPQWLARIDAQRIIKQLEDNLPFTDFAWDRVFSHWMPIAPPMEERKEKNNEKTVHRDRPRKKGSHSDSFFE